MYQNNEQKMSVIVLDASRLEIGLCLTKHSCISGTTLSRFPWGCIQINWKRRSARKKRYKGVSWASLAVGHIISTRFVGWFSTVWPHVATKESARWATRAQGDEETMKVAAELVVSATPPQIPSEFCCLQEQLQTPWPGSMTTVVFQPHGTQSWTQTFCCFFLVPFPLLPNTVSCSQTQVISYQTLHTFPSDSDLADDIGLMRAG